VSSGGGLPSPEGWRRLHDDWVSSARLQSLIGGLPTVQAGLVAVAAIGWWRRRSQWTKIARICAGCVLSLPSIGILAPAAGVRSPAWSCAILAVACALAGLVCYRSARSAHVWLAGATAATLAACLIALIPSSRWYASAWSSYSLMEGARYYGIGNEYAAALGASLLAALAFGSRALGRGSAWPSWAAATAGLAAACLVGHPGAGANAGGAAGIALGSVVLGIALRTERLRLRDGLTAIGAVVSVAALALWADSLRAPEQQSHVVRALLSADGPAGIALRKASMNLWLLAHSPWTPLLVVGVGGMAVLGWQGSRERDSRAWWAARAAIFWLAIGLFALNDSGVVAAAECLGVGVSALGLWAAVPRLDTGGPASVN
jgi:hypothetical protein